MAYNGYQCRDSFLNELQCSALIEVVLSENQLLQPIEHYSSPTESV